ncbi:MAG: ATP-binding protein [Terracidiphilus sp.]
MEPPKTSPIKSLYVGVLLAMAATLTLSFLAFNTISQRMQEIHFNPLFDRLDELQLETARGLFESSNRKGLRDYLDHLDRMFGGSHYLLGANGIDVLTGQSRAALLPPAPEVVERLHTRGRWILAHKSPDGRYWFAAEGQLGRPHIWTFLPYYFLVIAATGVLCWMAAVGVVSPIRRIATVISQFGQGNLSVRVHTSRPDEIGQLGRSFNEMAERLERLIVSERRLLGDISHELRSPLARLKFAIKLARTSPGSDAALNRIGRDVDRITSLVADILEITSFEGDPALRETELVPAASIVDEVVRDCALEAELRGCTIAVEGSLSGQVLGNRELLRRAIENVLRNGIRYAPEQSRIEISMHENDRDAIIAVRDRGPGVPEDALARIFDPFFRVEDARDAMGGGSGLGLSIAKRAVQLHRGAIAAENASPGLRVQITIPLAMEPVLN